jgi:hypothetical protein
MNDKIVSLPVAVVSTVNPTVVEMLEHWLEQAKAGELISLGAIGQRTNGEWQTGYSSSEHALLDAAMMIELAIRRMGFKLS